MIGVDTNILVRYFTQDDTEQAAKVNACFDQALQTGEVLFVNAIVLCELIWVLEDVYGFRKPEIAGALEKILRTRQLEVEARELAWRALADYRRAGADFADCLIARRNTAEGCSTSVTLDRAAAKLEGYRLL